MARSLPNGWDEHLLRIGQEAVTNAIRHALTLAGVVVGLFDAVVLTRVMASLLFGVGATDLMTFSAVPIAFIATAAVAICIPALRASRVDPTIALRAD